MFETEPILRPDIKKALRILFNKSVASIDVPGIPEILRRCNVRMFRTPGLRPLFRSRRSAVPARGYLGLRPHAPARDGVCCSGHIRAPNGVRRSGGRTPGQDCIGRCTARRAPVPDVRRPAARRITCASPLARGCAVTRGRVRR